MLQELEHFVGIDQDVSALEIAQQRLQQFEAKGVRLHYIHSNFRCGCSKYILEAGSVLREHVDSLPVFLHRDLIDTRGCARKTCCYHLLKPVHTYAGA